MNKVVLKWAPLPMLAVLLMTAMSPQALATRQKAHKQDHPAAAQKTSPLPALRQAAQVNPTYTSGKPGCLATRRKLWTDEGWIVRRVSACR